MRYIYFVFFYICIHIGLLLEKDISESFESQNAYPNALRPVKTEAIFPMFDKRYQATAVQPVVQPVQSNVPAVIFDIRVFLDRLMKPLKWFRKFFFTVKRRVKRSRKASERASELVVYDSNTSLSTVVIAHCEDLKTEYMRRQQLYNEAIRPCFSCYRISFFNLVAVTTIFTAFAGYTCKQGSSASVSSNEYEYDSNLEQSAQTFNTVLGRANRANEPVQLPIQLNEADQSNGIVIDDLTVKPLVIRKKNTISNATTSPDLKPEEASQAEAVDELTVKPLRIVKKSALTSATISSVPKREETTQAEAVDEHTVKPLRIVKKSALSSATISSVPKREEATFANNVTHKTALCNSNENKFDLSNLSIDDIVKLCRPCSYDDSCTDECYVDQVISKERDLEKDIRCSEPADVYEISNRILAEGFDCLSCDDIRDLTDVAARLPKPELPCSDYRGVWGYDLYSTSYSEHFETFKEVVSVCGMVASAVDWGINSLEFGHRLSEDIEQVREQICALYCIPENSNFRFTEFESMQDDFEAFRCVIGTGIGQKVKDRYVDEANDKADYLLEQWSTFMNERSDYLVGICVNTCNIIEKYREILGKDHRHTLRGGMPEVYVY